MQPAPIRFPNRSVLSAPAIPAMAAATAAMALTALVALTACAPAAPPPAPVAVAAPPPVDYIKSGIYETVDPSSPRTRIFLYLSPNHGFILRWAQAKESILEYRGAWSSDPDSLRLQVYDVRRPRTDLNYGRAEQMDTVIACPIQNGAAFPVPILKLASIKGGPRLVQMGKPPESGAAWEGEKTAKGVKGGKGGRTAAKGGKGGNGKVTPSAAAKAEAATGAAPKPIKTAEAVPKS